MGCVGTDWRVRKQKFIQMKQNMYSAMLLIGCVSSQKFPSGYGTAALKQIAIITLSE